MGIARRNRCRTAVSFRMFFFSHLLAFSMHVFFCIQAKIRLHFNVQAESVRFRLHFVQKFSEKK